MLTEFACQRALVPSCRLIDHDDYMRYRPTMSYATGHIKLTLLVLNRFSEIVHSHQPIPNVFLVHVLPDTDHLYITV